MRPVGTDQPFCHSLPPMNPPGIPATDASPRQDDAGGHRFIRFTLKGNRRRRLTAARRLVYSTRLLYLLGGCLVARVQVHDNENIESAIRRFKRQVAREGIITDSKKHAFYLKPGERKRLKSQVARRRARKSMRKRVTHDE